MNARAALKRHFGHGDFRPPQDRIIESILSGKDTLVIMPTGGGKSLCYQLPALLLDGVTLVVSPLIALMKDQVDALQAKGIAAAMINSAQGWAEQKQVLDQMERGALKLVYVAPERFRASSFLQSLRRVKIALLAIDEAHCISQWGHDFRPDYMRIGHARTLLGNPQCAAFTATATPDVREDIVRQLGIAEANVFVSGFARDNLSFHIRKVSGREAKESRIRALITRHKTGIVYCATRKSVETVSGGLKMDHIDHVVYHGGMSPSERDAAQEAFVSGKVAVAVATNAFGMGIDRADIRFVCHYELPGSVEAFYQEAGRAGRDGKASVCEMLFSYADKRVQDFFIEGANPELSLIRRVYRLLHQRGKSTEGHQVQLSVAEMTDLLSAEPESSGKVNPMGVATALGHLRRAEVIERFDVPGQGAQRGTRLLKPELIPAELSLPATALREKRDRDEEKLQAVIRLSYTHECRQQWVLGYFGEKGSAPCGRCDNCRSHSKARSLTDEEFTLVRKILSGVARMSQRIEAHTWEPRFGKARILQCLLGSRSEKITQGGLDQLSTYGILRTERKEFVSQLFDALEQARLIATGGGEYPLLGLTEQGSRVMFGELEISLIWPEAAAASPPVVARQARAQAVGQRRPLAGGRGGDGAGSATSVGGTGNSGAANAERELYKKLALRRNEMCKERGNLPAYMIFPNTVLEQLAAARPLDLDAAMRIKGIGPAKAASVLPEFLDIIRSHCGIATAGTS